MPIKRNIVMLNKVVRQQANEADEDFLHALRRLAEHDGVAFESLPEDWKCPRCKQPKSKFNKA